LKYLNRILSFETAATSSSPPGTYSITPFGLTSSNYDIGFHAGTLYIVALPAIQLCLFIL